jgi:N-acyl-D-aspartate/D-glutamate deacylase
MLSPAWRELAGLPMSQRIVRLRTSEFRTALITGMIPGGPKDKVSRRIITQFDRMYALGDPPDYEPDPHTSVAATAQREGRSPAEVAYDWMLERDGHALLYMPFANYVNGSLDGVADQLAHPSSVAGLSDGGAHVGTICDVSFPTSLLQWWGRDRPRGRLPLELLVHKQTRATAETVGLLDRGLLAPGHRGDVNVIDFDALRLHVPEFVYDLPAGGKRLLQRADGYLHTFVAGTEVRVNGESTGATPGRLLRGATPAP